jgi:hypothetical protein
MRIAVFYHCVLSGPRIPSEEHAMSVLISQMAAWRNSDLEKIADENHVGLNGTDSQAMVLSSVIPANSILHIHGPRAQTELSTLHELQLWLKPGWAVLYHHIKGVQYPDNPVWDRWRKCMQNACVWNWRACVEALEQGFDTAGAHWMTSKKYPMVSPDHRYWGGNFWWATSDYLLTLTSLPPDQYERRYDAEVWIGSGPRTPKARDFANHFPMSCK